MGTPAPERVGRPPQKDGLCIGTVMSNRMVERNGVLLKPSPEYLGVSLQKVFGLGTMQYRRRIAAQMRRIRKDLKELAEATRAAKGTTKTKTVVVARPSLPFDIDPDDLRVVNCANCDATLLAECLEYLRQDANEFKLRTVRNLPPPVCARLFGSRPYCDICVQTFLDTGRMTRLVGRRR